jgi:protease PrsW
MGLIVSGIIGITSSLLFSYVLYWLDRYEKEPILLLGGVFIWGAVVAAGSAFIINTVIGLGVYIFTNSSVATDLTTGSLIAPMVEETLKGLAVLGVFLLYRDEFDSILDGIIYAGVAALGFAATENIYYIYTFGFQESGWSGLISLAFVRVILVGWQHPFYTAFTGIGLAIARLNKNWLIKILAPLSGLSVASFLHALHNTLATLLNGLAGMTIGAAVDWTGWLFMFGIVLWATWTERQHLKKYLTAELQVGTITPVLYRTATSAWLQMRARISAILTGKYGKTVRFYQACGEYAHKRWQYDRLGDESGNLVIIQQLRREIAQLTPDVQA